jgi:hypothetical protein
MGLFRFKSRRETDQVPQDTGLNHVQSGPNQSQVLPPGFEHIDQTLPEDIFIVGYPKSGNTWFQNLVSALAYGMNAGWSPAALVHHLVPDVHHAKVYRRYSTPSFFKSHHLPRPEYRRVVYLLRDGRDAMVSYFHYREATERTKLDFLEFVQGGAKLFPCRWHEHVESWMNNPYSAERIVIKYEDLLANPVEQLQRFCSFAGLERTPAFIKAAAESAAFRTLRRKEEQQGFPDHNFTEGNFFFRRGVAGSHKDEMPEAVLAAFMSEASSTLQKMGYLQ